MIFCVVCTVSRRIYDVSGECSFETTATARWIVTENDFVINWESNLVPLLKFQTSLLPRPLSPWLLISRDGCSRNDFGQCQVIIAHA